MTTMLGFFRVTLDESSAILRHHRLFGMLGLTLLTALLVACGSQSSEPLAQATQPAQPEPTASLPAPQADDVVRPLADIIVGEPTFTDAGGNSFTVELDTRIPVVCAAAYGTTTAYGKLATDTDMAGGGHENHRPMLTGLQPDTEYQVRLQGVGADGTLYRSENLTFRTPKAEAETEAEAPRKPSGPNLALRGQGAQVIGVSSNFGGGGNDSTFGANKAFDGDPNTEWSSDGDGDDAWIEIEYESDVRVTAIGFWTRTMGSSAQIFAFRVVTDRGETIGPFTLEDANGAYYFETDFNARRLRFEMVDTSGGNTGAVEIELYGEAEPAT